MAETAKAQRTLEEIKAAARTLLVRKGYAETKITDITTEAGKAAGSFYRYFTDKDALLRALIEDFQGALHNRVVSELGAGHQLSTREDVRRHVELYWTTYEQYLPEMVGAFQASMLNQDFRRVHLQLRERELQTWTQHIVELHGKAGARLKALSIVCMLEYFCYSQLTADGKPVDRRASITTLTDMIAHGLGCGAP
jgi:AcrR family transcriptional regulator